MSHENYMRRFSASEEQFRTSIADFEGDELEVSWDVQWPEPAEPGHPSQVKPGLYLRAPDPGICLDRDQVQQLAQYLDAWMEAVDG